MYVTKSFTLKNESGFHVRPAEMFTKKAGSFLSDIRVKVNDTGTEVDGKSILGLMTLGIGKGANITITANGPDAEEAMAALAELVESGFGEVAEA